MQLSAEQQNMISVALQGKNILVDACIGSGKTTTIQQLCLQIPVQKRILYLTYNKLLKEDAQNKIRPYLRQIRPFNNYEVLNYNGYAYKYLIQKGISVGQEEQMNRFNKEKPNIPAPDVLIIDEYQDIREDHAEMLRYIKSTNPNMQIIMVGDLKQKIYSHTALNVDKFIDEFLGEYEKLTFTTCYRINAPLANMLGDIWHKKINGVNDDCILCEMSFDDCIGFLKDRNPSEILCLGSRTGQMSDALNILEERWPEKFNKKTVFASISDKEANITVDRYTAIFTTYDSSKGMERDFCVVFDWTDAYWKSRSSQTNVEYEILRNLFCVAASRGKRGIIFVRHKGQKLLSQAILGNPFNTNLQFNRNLDISGMFDFQFEEHIRNCYDLLDIKQKNKKDMSSIDVKVTDEKIDLSPCIGIYQEACFFNGFKMEDEYKLFNRTSNYYLSFKSVKDKSLDEQICTLVSAKTQQERYKTQVVYPLITEEERNRICKRLGTVFSRSDKAQVGSTVHLGLADAVGYADVVKNDVVYELKFVSELQYTHYLQCAMYMIGLGLDKGVLWNVRTNEAYEIRIKDRTKFLNAVLVCITKGNYSKK